MTFHGIGISGSLRKESHNTALVLMAQRLAAPELDIELIDWIDQLPWMNPDLEHDPPEIVQRWWDTLRAADALIVGMPEYNWNPTPLAKNALDWSTRPPTARAIDGTVVAFLSSGGRSGGAKSQENITTILNYLGATVVIDPPVQFSLVGDRINADGTTTDPDIEAAVAAKMAAVIEALRARRTPE